MKTKILSTLMLLSASFLSYSQCATIIDDFESGTTSLWSVMGSMSPSSQNSGAAQGTYYIKGTGGSTQHMKGVETSFTSATPQNLSWYIKPTGSLSCNNFVAGDATMTASKNMVFCYYRGALSDIVFVNGSSALFSYPVTPGTWYFIELKNINFTTHKYDIYINGTLWQTAFTFRSSLVNNISKVHLYNYDAGTEGYWDQIKYGVNSTTICNAATNNTSSTAGLTSSTHSQAAGQSVYYASSGCNAISLITSTTNLGSTTAKVKVESALPIYNTQPYVARWYEITPTTQGSADVTFYFTQADFNNYNTYANANGWPRLPQNATDATGKANMRITKNGTGLGNTPVVLTPTSIIWNATNSYWEVTVNTPSFSQFRFHAVNPLNSALPVSISSFTGKKENNVDVLSWITYNEMNNRYFEIQHSKNGVDFTTIGTVNTKSLNNFSNENLTYTFENKSPNLGHNYYRLNQVDIDGKNYLSNVIDIVTDINGTTISLYPNPINDFINIDLATIKQINVQISILDMSGRIVKELNTITTMGNNHYQININDLAKGMYQVRVVENSRVSFVEKIIK